MSKKCHKRKSEKTAYIASRCGRHRYRREALLAWAARLDCLGFVESDSRYFGIGEKTARYQAVVRVSRSGVNDRFISGSTTLHCRGTCRDARW